MRSRLLDSVRSALRLRHYSPGTEDAYVASVRRYVRSSGLRHPSERTAGVRLKDVDVASRSIVVRAGKGDKDRVTMLPDAACAPLVEHLDAVLPTPCCGSHLPSRRRGHGGGFSPRRGRTSTQHPAFDVATPCTSPRSSARSASPCCRPG